MPKNKTTYQWEADHYAQHSAWIRSTWLPYLERVPPHSKESFIEDILESYLEHHPLDGDGIAHVK